MGSKKRKEKENATDSRRRTGFMPSARREPHNGTGFICIFVFIYFFTFIPTVFSSPTSFDVHVYNVVLF